jgi:putative colanic acid biosynthesis acetyltransferase WcaF
MSAPRKLYAVPQDRGPRPSPHPLRNKAMRALWGLVRPLLFRPSPKVMHGWRRFLLRLFGARIAPGAIVHPSVRIWAPWNLEMGPNACLSPEVDCYSVDRITLGANAVVSRRGFLCTATHDPDLPDMPLVTAPITIGPEAWVAADVFVGPGVAVGEGAVVGARASVFGDVPPWTVVVGNPARPLRMRRRPGSSDLPRGA